MSRTPWPQLPRPDLQERTSTVSPKEFEHFPASSIDIEFVRERNGVRYYNDSKATNVDATEKAIDAFPGNLWIILGGKDKGSDYTVLKDKLSAKARASC